MTVEETREFRVIRFTVHAGEIVPEQRRVGKNKATGKVCVYKTNRMRGWMQWIWLEAQSHRPEPLLSGPLELSAVFHLHRPKRLPARTAEIHMRHAVRPDLCDNLMKPLCDSLKGVIWGDDGQVSDAHLRKRYCAAGEGPNVEITIREAAEE